MSVKLIIFITGKPTLHGHKRREFHWSPAHGCYLYEGSEIKPSEFNAKYEKAMKTNSDLLPRVKVIDASAESAAPISDKTPAGETFAIEEQLNQAEAVINRYAPERLKKRQGAKPQAIEV